MLKYKSFFYLLFFLTIQNFCFADNTFKPFTGKVTGNKVRVRAEPDLEGHIINQLNKDHLILVVGEKNDYYAIKPFEETKLYVFRSYIIDNVVEAERVNIRLTPDTNAPIVGQLKSKQQIDGTLYTNDNKWLEIAPPSNVYFYVAKDFVSNAGDSSYYVLMQERKEEALKLLDSAFFITQAECKKPFNEMNTEKAKAQFEAIIKEYSDFPQYVEQAKEGLTLIQDNYLQKKIVYLETKANMLPEEKEELFKEVASLREKKPQQKKIIKPVEAQPKSDNLWSNLENELYSTWTTFHPEKSTEDFYLEQKANSIVIKGKIEPYDISVKNKPGNFILKENNMPKAYLYSTQIDLNKFSGEEVSLSVSPRPNNNFAFPAYFVNEIK